MGPKKDNTGSIRDFCYFNFITMFQRQTLSLRGDFNLCLSNGPFVHPPPVYFDKTGNSYRVVCSENFVSYKKHTGDGRGGEKEGKGPFRKDGWTVFYGRRHGPYVSCALSDPNKECRF